MDVVYLCRSGENEELRYSLRSLVNMPHDRVWVFGGCPSWLSCDGYVPVSQSGAKNSNARRNLETACRHPEVSDPFILMNDDFFIVQPLDSLPVLHRGTVAEVIADHEARGLSRSTYTQAMRDTAARLAIMGHAEPLSYSLHIPMTVSKAGMLMAIAAGEGIDRAQYRTLYGNIARVGGVKVADVKLRHRRDPFPSGPFVSTSDRTFNRALPRLRKLFPEPSDYEREGVPVVPTYTSPVRVTRKGRLIAYAGEIMSETDAKRRGLITAEKPESEPLPDYDAMTVREIKDALDAAGVAYPARATKPVLLEIIRGDAS